MKNFEYKKFPDKFTKKYLTDENSISFIDYGYDKYLDGRERDKEYIEHFFQLNERLKFSFRYYNNLNEISNIHIQTEEGCNDYENFYRMKILNDIKRAFNIEKQTFDWDFSFEEYVN